MRFATCLTTFIVAGTASAATLTPWITKGCGIRQDFVGQVRVNNTIESSGGTRTYDVYLPPFYNEHRPTPLIIAYHGNGGTPAKQRGLDQFDNHTLNPDHIAVWPAGVEGHWQGPAYAVAGVSDKVFTTDLINRLRDDFCIDNRRIYAAGKSNGGGFTDTLACSHGHGRDFAAFAACSGAFYTDDVPSNESDGDVVCHPARSPLPYMEFHGSKDTTIPYNGICKDAGCTPAIPDWAAAWGRRNGCAKNYVAPNTTYRGLAQVHETKYTCRGIQAVTQYYIEGMDHSWPSTSENSDNGPQGHGDGPTVINASPIILDFFRRNYKPFLDF